MTEAALEVGFDIPPWTVETVDPARMKTMAAILRDPYPVHWDRTTVAQMGHGDRVINQGPLSLGYIANMLMAWQGPTSIRRLQARFRRPVFDGDHAQARGVISEIIDAAGERQAICAVRLVVGDEDAVVGVAHVALLTDTGVDRP